MNTTAVQEAVRAGNEVGYMVPLDLGPAYADPEPRVPRQPERPHNSHSIIHTKQLPGPLAMQRLLRLDALYELDEFHAVTAECAHTLYGRAMLMRDILPNRTTACGRTAAWVWVGGRLPQDYFEVLSSSHYRRLAFGRRIKAWQRQVDESQISTLNTLNLTTPLRTACDLAMYPRTTRMRATCSRSLDGSWSITSSRWSTVSRFSRNARICAICRRPARC